MWTLLVIIFVLTFSLVSIYNLYKGVYWVIFPIICIPINTLFASLIGRAIGKTPLNQHLPNKTVEGYLGGMIGTIIFGFYVSFILVN